MPAVLDLQPVLRLSRPINTIRPLGDDAFETEVAGMLEDCRAITFEMLDILQIAYLFAEQLLQRRFAVQERLAAIVHPVKFQQIECAQGRPVIIETAMQ